MNVRYEKFDVGLYVNLITKKYDFDRVVLFVNFVLCESIDFTGVLWDLCVVYMCVLMCYLFIKYMIFGWVRLKPYFIRAERYFEDIFDDFWWCWKWWKRWFFKVLPNSVSNSKWGFRCGNIRYALSGNRTFVLKCKLCPLMVWKHTIIVQYYSVFLADPLSGLLQLIRCNSPVYYPVKQKYLTRFDVRLRWYRKHCNNFVTIS